MPSTDTTDVEAALERLYSDVAAADLQPLWTQTRNLMPGQPLPQTRPWLWRWETLRALAERAGELITIERGGERRVLALSNPGLGGLPFASSTLWGAIQYLGPRESAPAHRHTPGAIRFVIEGQGVSTTVDGDACDMHAGDLVLTPSWTWHDHRSDGDQPMIWFDGLDMPTVIALDAVFYENYPDLMQPVASTHGRTASAWGDQGLRPLEHGRPTSGRRPSAPPVGQPADASPLIYRWADTDAALAALLDEHGGPIASLEFVDPATGGPTLPTLGCEAHRVVPGARTPTTRKVGSSVWVVYRGRGETVVNGTRLRWHAGDMFVTPSWAAVDHRAEEAADLFAISDRPILDALGLYRHERLDEPQAVTGDFAPAQVP